MLFSSPSVLFAPQRKYNMITKKTSLLFYLSKPWSLIQHTLQNTLHGHQRGVLGFTNVCVVLTYYKTECECVHKKQHFYQKDKAVVFYIFVNKSREKPKNQQSVLFLSIISDFPSLHVALSSVMDVNL